MNLYTIKTDIIQKYLLPNSTAQKWIWNKYIAVPKSMILKDIYAIPFFLLQMGCNFAFGYRILILNSL